MDKQTKKKSKIAEAAAKRYIENPRFTIQSLANELDMKSAEVFGLFPNRKSILLFFYESRLLAYHEQKKSIEGFEEFTLSEKLSNLFLTILDQFLEYREFVLETYGKFIARNPVYISFEQEFKKELKDIFQSDVNITGTSRFFTNGLLYATVYYHFHALILFWSKDESEKYERSFALVDKWCSLIEELFYSKIVDKGLDLGKFLLYNSPFKQAFSSINQSSDK